jgi:hypothetical protein
MAMKYRSEGTMGVPADSPDERVAALVALAYELLDAHDDTARLDTDGGSDEEWSNHLAYLRDLQRVGRETLARAASVPAVRASAVGAQAVRAAADVAGR